MDPLILYLAFFFLLTCIGVYIYRIWLAHTERFERLRLDTQERIAVARMEEAKAEADTARYTAMLHEPKSFTSRYPAGRLN